MQIGDTVYWFNYNKLTEGILTSLRPLKVLTSSGTVKGKHLISLFPSATQNKVYFISEIAKKSYNNEFHYCQLNPRLDNNTIELFYIDKNFNFTNRPQTIIHPSDKHRFKLISEVPQPGMKFKIPADNDRKEYTCSKIYYKQGAKSVMVLDEQAEWYGIISNNSKLIVKG